MLFGGSQRKCETNFIEKFLFKDDDKDWGNTWWFGSDAIPMKDGANADFYIFSITDCIFSRIATAISPKFGLFTACMEAMGSMAATTVSPFSFS